MCSLDHLDIVGYANVLTESTVPSIVAPVFRDRHNKDVYLFPPFTIRDHHLCDPVVSTERDFNHLVAKKEVTCLPETFQAKSDYELWVDDQMNAHYERAVRVQEQLESLAKTYTETAEKQLKKKDMDAVDRYCSRAISANGNYIAAWAMKAAIRIKQGKPDNADLLADLIRNICTKEDFDCLVKKYLSQPDSHINRMADLACLRDKDVLSNYFPLSKAA